ncbi:N-acetylneuraminate synthase family protein [Candidatus Pseudothioglobus singularis]|jgi:sialic acid synthase SpsE|nr:N-acetylneuraminate synthase family protein [Candidatus Pseudothioglobus singularis]
MASFNVNGNIVGEGGKTYFIADIAANHDGSLSKAIELIHLASDSGASAVKFQHFQAEKIVSKFGFESLGGKYSHQSKWKKSVDEIYKEAEVDHEWTTSLISAANDANVDFFSAPYDFESLELLESLNVPAYKVGSGDITWLEIIEKMASYNKPIFIATGASNLADVDRACNLLSKDNLAVCLMQCNTNYTGSLENFKYINLNVLKVYKLLYPEFVLGLSDHSPGCATTLGAVALGASAIEKHFTSNSSSEGPDHAFSMMPKEWREMVDRTRELELSLGKNSKEIEENEKETVVLQRRSIRAARDIKKGEKINKDDLVSLRPAPAGSFSPYQQQELIGRKTFSLIKKGDILTFNNTLPDV